jgi:long-chain acyl-CoA synthetase
VQQKLNTGPNADTVVDRFLYNVVHRRYQRAVLVKSPSGMYQVLDWYTVGAMVGQYVQYFLDRGFKSGDRVAIFADNSPEWFYTDLAVQRLGGITVPIYATSENLQYILDDCTPKFLLFGAAQQKRVSCIQGAIADRIEAPLASNQLSDEHAVSLLIDREECLPSKPSRQDMVSLIYTSGTTGDQKGAIMLHGNIAASCESLERAGFDFTSDDLFLSCLPLSHCYAHGVQMLCVWKGVASVFCTTDPHVLPETLKATSPTIFISVPLMLDRVKRKVLTCGGIKKALIQWALRQAKPGMKHDIADRLVFKKVRAGLGGRVRLFFCGGAALDTDTLQFFETVGLPLRQGYGLTETAGGIAVNRADANRPGSVGQLIDCMEAKIIPDPDSADGIGELWLKGNCLFPGYWNQPEKFDDGFLTGDLASIDADGYVYIHGRKKDTFKTSAGKWIAPDKIANAFAGNDLIDHVVVVGNGEPFVGALFFVNQLAAKAILEKEGVAIDESDATAFYAANVVIRERVKHIVTLVNKTKLEHWEQVHGFEIVPDEATIKNRLLTDTNKVRRNEVIKRFFELVRQIYKHKSK